MEQPSQHGFGREKARQNAQIMLNMIGKAYKDYTSQKKPEIPAKSCDRSHKKP